ncbi:MAG: hypothetical protein FWG57_05540 [Endomicrobia bacterium]|nr:hypothetical protein [Endomicrobiia bacterium]
MAIKNLTTVLDQFVLVDLREYFNNDAFSHDYLKCDGNFDSGGATYPAEELPRSNSIICNNGIPFFFPSKNDGFLNNMALNGQTICIPNDIYKCIHILGAVEGSGGEVYEEEVTISFENGTYKTVILKLSNWLLPAKYNEIPAFYCSHLHYPDMGQIPNANTKIQNIKTYIDDRNISYQTQYDKQSDIENINKNIWRPRIWLQKTTFKFKQEIVALTFMENINFHIFSMTLEK